jgi:DNA-binding NarL/FixJ family response regulator
MKEGNFLVADDRQVFREGLYRLPGVGKDRKVVTKPAKGEENVSPAEEPLPDVAIMGAALRNLYQFNPL